MDDAVRPLADGQMIDYIDNFRGKGFVIAPASGGAGC